MPHTPTGSDRWGTTDQRDDVESPDIHFEPIISLDPVEVKTLEEDETEVFRMRAKLFRMNFDFDPPEWKERGVGDVRILKQHTSDKHRILMRRDKTHKICCNHFITKEMKLVPNVGSDRAWVWSTHADFADEEVKHEQLAIRFANAENAKKFKDVFEECQEKLTSTEGVADAELAAELERLEVKEENEGGEEKSTEREKKAEEKEEEEVGKAQETKGEKEEAPAYGDADHTSPQPS